MGPARQKPDSAPKRKARKRKPLASGHNVFSLRSPASDVHSFVRSEFVGNLTPAPADKGWAWNFTLGELSGASEFTALFDRYRVNKLEYTFCLTYTAPTGVWPVLMVAPDYDTLNVPSTVATWMQVDHQRVVLTSSDPQATFTFVPRVSSDIAAGSAGVVAGLAKPRQWLDCNRTDISHNGLVMWIQGFNSTLTPGNITLTIKAHMQFCGVR